MSEQMYEFLERVHTFVLGTWLYHSSDLSPYVLAARGFKYHSTHIIECHMCHAQISFERLKIGEQSHALEQKILQQLKEHNKDCIYSGVITPEEDLYILKRPELSSNMDSIFSKIKDTYSFFKGNLPKISQATWGKYMQMYESVFSKNNPKFQDGKEIDLVKLLSIFGWQLVKEESPKLNCNFCGRTVEISSYLTTESDRYKILSSGKEGPNDKYFEPVGEHRYFCIWGHYDDFRENPMIYGWEMCLKQLLDKLLDVEKGWGEREKFHEVTQMKQKFSKIIQEFSQKTKNSVAKFNQLTKQAPPLQNQQDQETYNHKMQETQNAVENILQEVDKVVKPLAKKIKYA